MVATRRQILRLKRTKFNFSWDSAPDPAGGAYSALQTLHLRGGEGNTVGRSTLYCFLWIYAHGPILFSIWPFSTILSTC